HLRKVSISSLLSGSCLYGIRSSGSFNVSRRIISLCSGSPGIIAGFPDLLFASASVRNNKLNPDFLRTPPWHVMHFLLKMGLTSVLKSTVLLLVLDKKITRARIRSTTTINTFPDRNFMRHQSI